MIPNPIDWLAAAAIVFSIAIWEVGKWPLCLFVLWQLRQRLSQL
jgi:hypothetical protein